jgi:hypothetical protein
MNVPIKNLKRWVLNGPKRKKGGRKTHDPQMETKLFDWICQFKEIYKELPSRKKIKEMAIKYSNFSNSFKASKGWYEKFMIRHFKKKESICGNKEWNEVKQKMLKKIKKDGNQKDELDDFLKKEGVLVKLSKDQVQERIDMLWNEFKNNDLSGDIKDKVNDFILNVFSNLNEKENRVNNSRNDKLLNLTKQNKIPNMLITKNEPNFSNILKIEKPLFSPKSKFGLKNECLFPFFPIKKETFQSISHIPSIKSKDIKQEPFSIKQELKIGEDPSLNSKNEESIFVPNSNQQNDFDSDREKFLIYTNSSLKKTKPISSTIKSESLLIKSEQLNDKKTWPNRLLNLVEINKKNMKNCTPKTKKIKVRGKEAMYNEHEGYKSKIKNFGLKNNKNEMYYFFINNYFVMIILFNFVVVSVQKKIQKKSHE